MLISKCHANTFKTFLVTEAPVTLEVSDLQMDDMNGLDFDLQNPSPVSFYFEVTSLNNIWPSPINFNLYVAGR